VPQKTIFGFLCKHKIPKPALLRFL
jgi:hypothetical protein